MKKRIDGRIYNTETATLIAEHNNGKARNDLAFQEEQLYRKKNGEFFIYGCGNANSWYAQPTKDGWYRSGEQIVPIDAESAERWGRKHMTTDKYSTVFGQ